MSLRYYLAPVAGSGTDADPYRADLPALGGTPNHAALIPTRPDGTPRAPFAVVHVGAPALQHTAMRLSQKYRQAPSDLDTQMTSDERSAVVAWMQHRGERVDVPAVLTWRDMLEVVGRYLDRRFALAHLRASDQ